MAPNRRRTALVVAMVVGLVAAIATFVGFSGNQPTAARPDPPQTVGRIAPTTSSAVPPTTPTTEPRSTTSSTSTTRPSAPRRHRAKDVDHVRRHRHVVRHAAARKPAQPARLAGSLPPSRTWTVQANAPATVYAKPGAQPLVSITPTTALGALWMPVYRVRGAWEEIGLPGPPNGMTGWVLRSDVHQKLTNWSVVVSISHRTETVYHSGRQLAEAPVAVGAPGTPTPTGHTFIDGDLPTVGQFAVESPVLRPLALNSTSQLAATEIGGTLVALHGWEDLSSDPGVFGYAVSHGCIRAPAGPLTNALQEIPTGSPVWVEA